MSSVADAPRNGSLHSGAVREVLHDPMGLFGAALVAGFLATALFAPWIAPDDPITLDVPQKSPPPSLAYWAGTDQLGRDTLSRII